MNELLESKIVISQIITQLLDLAEELVVDQLSTKDYSIKRIMGIVEFTRKMMFR